MKKCPKGFLHTASCLIILRWYMLSLGFYTFPFSCFKVKWWQGKAKQARMYNIKFKREMKEMKKRKKKRRKINKDKKGGKLLFAIENSLMGRETSQSYTSNVVLVKLSSQVSLFIKNQLRCNERCCFVCIIFMKRCGNSLDNNDERRNMQKMELW